MQTEIVKLAELRPHPRNYRAHPDDQLDHLIESIREHGIYRPIVVARDGTILAGHGVCQAAARMGVEDVPVYRLDLDRNSPRALKLLAGDNEISHLVEADDRVLSELLKEIKDTDLDGLLGTGYDDKMLANLVFVTRPEREIRDFDEAAEWVGLPEYDPDASPDPYRVIVSLRNEEDRRAFFRLLGIENFTDNTKSAWWPARDREDLSSLRLQSA